MEHLIRFKLLSDELHDAETPMFLQKLLDMPNMYQLIVSSIFSHFASKIIHSKTFDEGAINNITNIIHQIVHSRQSIDDDDDDDDDDYGQSLDSIPSELISVTSSFLSFKDYIAFQLCNRALFIGCNSPCSLSTYSAPCVRNPLRIDINKCSSLRHISLDWSSKTAKDQSNVKQQIFDLIANTNYRYFDNITRLSIGPFGDGGVFFNSFISKFPCLEHLELRDMGMTAKADFFFRDRWSVPSMPNLRALSLRIGSFFLPYNKLLLQYACTIVSLSCTSNVLRSRYRYDLTNLRHLKLYINGGDALKNLVTKTNLLETVCIDMNYPKTQHYKIINGTLSLDEKQYSWMKVTIRMVFHTQIQLKYFEMRTNINKMNIMCEEIAIGLKLTRKYKHNTMTIQTVLYDSCKTISKKVKWGKIKDGMKKIIAAFEETNMDWMISCKVIRRHNPVSFSAQDRTAFDAWKREYLVHYFEKDKRIKVVISNRENQMDGGYKPSGIYIL
eukprot:185965_1